MVGKKMQASFFLLTTARLVSWQYTQIKTKYFQQEQTLTSYNKNFAHALNKYG